MILSIHMPYPFLQAQLSLQPGNLFPLEESENYSGPSIIHLSPLLLVLFKMAIFKNYKNKILFAKLINSYTLTYSTHLSLKYEQKLDGILSCTPNGKSQKLAID